ncbi:sodium:calcium antiporter [Halobacteriales archaeon QS_8_69_26]|nr:MAG: sodium:calcium antiporter [Halobacteriales archaeon QS_8_69_26]
MSALHVAELSGLALVSTAFIWWGGETLEKTSDKLASYYGLPLVVQGALIAALGSSFPELSTTVVATLLHGEFDLGVGAIVGSAIFNLLVIPALSGIVGDEIESNRDIVYKEAQFYMVAVSALIIVFAMAVIYNPTDGDALRGNVTRPLAAVPVLLYGVYVFIQYADVADHEAEAEPPDVSPGKQWGLLLVSLVVIAIAVEGLVDAALGFRDLFGTSSFLWGVTIVAAGTSLPDAIVSLRAAQDERGVASIANVLGSNTFDLLVAIPAGVLIAGTAAVNFQVAVPLMGFLTLATIVVFAFLRTGLKLSLLESYTLLVVYVLFVAWMVLETISVTNVIPGT